MPYLFPFPNGTISQGIKAQHDELNNNFIVAGGGANGGSFDNDDGSSFYHMHHNVEVYGGHKRCAVVWSVGRRGSTGRSDPGKGPPVFVAPCR